MHNVKKSIRLIYFAFTLFFVQSAQAGSFTQDSLSAVTHEHTPWQILSGSGDESIVCYKSTHRDIYLLVTALVIVIAVIAIKLLLLNRGKNKMLKKHNVLIEEKNKNITDSINYAKRLQNAILPSNETIARNLADHFIFYMPKDIVSGDFYWVSGHSDKVIISAVDCTGHGVPGALLSIVGHNAFNQSVNELHILQPSKILDAMDGIIKKVLHQDGGMHIKDGMDMALCCLNKNTLQLEYAGANNPLYVVSDKKLSVVKASKITIGTIDKEVKNPIENHVIQLKKGDCFYIFSDGYSDQFGGAENKKFKSNQLRELLLSLNSQTMGEQKKIIAETFKKWQGKNEQVDDVLIIGIRV